MRLSRDGRRTLAAAVVGVAAGAAIYGIGSRTTTGGTHADSAPAPGSTVSTAAVARPGNIASGAQSAASVGPSGALPVDLPASLAHRAGVAVTPVGGGAVLTAGGLQTGAAWSTSKVPLAVAALHADPGPLTKGLVRRAITQSDNAAAEQLWDRLGGGPKAAHAMDEVLADLGDATTRTQDKRTRPPWSPFGQTQWRVEDAAVVAAHLACTPSASAVYDLMAQVSAGQRWGLGEISGSRFKGGWGPEEGGYLVRQLGVVDTPSGRAGVAVMVFSDRGFDAAVRDLNAITAQLRQHLAALPAGTCFTTPRPATR